MTDKVRQASSVSLGACDFCAGVHVNLLDEFGEVFATAVVPHEVWPEFVRRGDALVAANVTRLAAPPRRQ